MSGPCATACIVNSTMGSMRPGASCAEGELRCYLTTGLYVAFGATASKTIHRIARQQRFTVGTLRLDKHPFVQDISRANILQAYHPRAHMSNGNIKLQGT
eukprot:4349872-Amphidinium_carterae.1